MSSQFWPDWRRAVITFKRVLCHINGIVQTIMHGESCLGYAACGCHGSQWCDRLWLKRGGRRMLVGALFRWSSYTTVLSRMSAGAGLLRKKRRQASAILILYASQARRFAHQDSAVSQTGETINDDSWRYGCRLSVNGAHATMHDQAQATLVSEFITLICGVCTIWQICIICIIFTKHNEIIWDTWFIVMRNPSRKCGLEHHVQFVAHNISHVLYAHHGAGSF